MPVTRRGNGGCTVDPCIHNTIYEDQIKQDGWIYRNRVRRKPGDLPASAASECSRESIGELLSPLCLHGCPTSAPSTNDVVMREIYILSNEVTAGNIGSTQTRTWKRDPTLDPEVTLEPDNYKGANTALHTDHGHQAPLASFTGTAYWRETNYFFEPGTVEGPRGTSPGLKPGVPPSRTSTWPQAPL